MTEAKLKSAVIYGPPGTGKSTEIIRRMRSAIEAGIPASRIGLVSFTKAAAHELAHRVGVAPGKNISTLHSYAFRLAGMSRAQVVDREKLQEFSKVSRIETTGAGVYDQESLGPGDYYLAMLGFARSRMLTSLKQAFYEGGRQGSLVEFEHFVKVYNEWKAAYGYKDFADMLDDARHEPGENVGVDLLFMDEAQDFSAQQWALIHHWMPHLKEAVVALDDDQTLYKFNGAYPDGGPQFERRYGSERVVLRQSYRVPKSVHGMAVRLIGNVKSRVDKEYLPRDHEGRIRMYSDLHLVPVPDHEQETLILFRNHSQREPIEAWLKGAGVPYLTDNGRPGPLQGFQAATLRAWQRAKSAHAATGQTMCEPREWVVMRRAAMRVHVRHFEAERIEHLLEKPWWQVFSFPADTARFFQRLEHQFGTTLPDTKIRLSTMHGSKGREADRVILLNGMSERTAQGYLHDPDTEIRTFYVAATRTRGTLDIVAAENPVEILYTSLREKVCS